MPATPKILYHNIPNITSLTSVTITEAYNSTMSQAIIECYDTSLDIGDQINFNIGYSGNYGAIFYGYVRNIDAGLPEARNRIICEDELSKATDYFMASDDPEEPFSRNNIKTEDLIEDILNEAQITNYTHDVPLEVIWGTQGEIEFNLTTAWQAADIIAGALAWHLYADRSGQVHLIDRPPYEEGGDSADFTWNNASQNILVLDHTRSTENLRNRIVVYGKNNITATASQSSPYLPAGFYKTAVIATQAIDSQSQANQAASNNLELMNRLTEALQIQIEGDYQIEPRKFASVVINEPDISLTVSGLWFIYQVEHRIDNSGYICNVTLTK